MPGTNWYVNAGGFQGLPGGTTVGGGGDTAVIQPRDGMDAQRMANGFAPGASYPDGYLGTITDRREDRVLGAVQQRLTDRSYQRGVHKGEKMGMDSYYWTPEVNPQAGIERQAMAQPVNVDGGMVWMTPRNSPGLDPVEKLVNGGKNAITPPEQMDLAKQYSVDPGRSNTPLSERDPAMAATLEHLLPRYAR